MSRLRAAAIVLIVPCIAGWAAGCAKAQAKAIPESVPLEVPAAPPRVIAAVVPDPPPEEPPAPAPPAAPARPPARPRPTRETPPRAEPSRAEPAAPRPAPTPRLRTPQTATDVEVERKIREALTRATRALDGVNPAALNPDARSQYDTARRFIQQAEEGVQAKNYVFAGNLADKAETIAAALLDR